MKSRWPHVDFLILKGLNKGQLNQSQNWFNNFKYFLRQAEITVFGYYISNGGHLHKTETSQFDLFVSILWFIDSNAPYFPSSQPVCRNYSEGDLHQCWWFHLPRCLREGPQHFAVVAPPSVTWGPGLEEPLGGAPSPTGGCKETGSAWSSRRGNGQSR